MNREPLCTPAPAEQYAQYLKYTQTIFALAAVQASLGALYFSDAGWRAVSFLPAWLVGTFVGLMFLQALALCLVGAWSWAQRPAQPSSAIPSLATAGPAR